jgi:hypothetical protein
MRSPRPAARIIAGVTAGVIAGVTAGSSQPAALERVPRRAHRREALDQPTEQRLCARRVVLPEVADVDVDGGGIELGPGVHRHVRFGEQQHAGDADRRTGACVGPRLEAVEDLGDRRQAGRLRSRPAHRAQGRRIGHRGAAGGASVQVGREVQSAHVEGHYPGRGRAWSDP